MPTVVSVVGARPQFIKLAPVCREIRFAQIDHVIVHTGQHYDEAMSELFFRELGIPEPERNLGVGSGPHGVQTARMLEGLERALVEIRPDGCLVYGDTNSTLAAALAAAKLHVPVFHVEAGLRSHNRAMPEEINRIATDHISDVLLCPSARAVEELRTEGIVTGVHLVGDVMYDAVLHGSAAAGAASQVLDELGLAARGYFLATVHRPRNTDRADRLRQILEAFSDLPHAVVFPVHPRTRHALDRLGGAVPGNVRLVPPVGYLDMMQLLRHARALLTDSGGMQKEAFFLGTPCVTLREETEWVETIDAGWNRLVGASPEQIVSTVAEYELLDWRARASAQPQPYGDGHAAGKIVEVVGEMLDR